MARTRIRWYVGHESSWGQPLTQWAYFSWDEEHGLPVSRRFAMPDLEQETEKLEARGEDTSEFRAALRELVEKSGLPYPPILRNPTPVHPGPRGATDS